MGKIPVATWREMGNSKFTRALHPAMLTSSGYIVQTSTKDLGSKIQGIHNVTYDFEYAAEFVSRKVFKPLLASDTELIYKLLARAWELSNRPDDLKSIEIVDKSDGMVVSYITGEDVA